MREIKRLKKCIVKQAQVGAVEMKELQEAVDLEKEAREKTE